MLPRTALLLGAAGKWRARGWAVVQLDYDEEMGSLHGLYGSTEAELEVQRTIKWVELTAFLCLLKKVIGPNKVHVDNKGIIDGLWRRGRKCIDSKAGDADLWIKIWKELHLLTSREILVEVEHATAHRTEKDKKEMWHFGKFVTDGNEKADELAKAGAMLDDGFMAQVRANTLQQQQYVASFHCLVKDWKDCEERLSQKKMEFHGKEKGGNEASYGVVCGVEEIRMREVWKRQQVHDDARQIHRAEIHGKEFGKMEKVTHGRT